MKLHRMDHDPKRSPRLSGFQWLVLVAVAAALALSVAITLLELSRTSTPDQDLCVGVDTTQVSCPSDTPSP